MKVIYVGSCAECPYRFCRSKEYLSLCILTPGCVLPWKIIDSISEVPKWCPLENTDLDPLRLVEG
jgi:hypothetical protein